MASFNIVNFYATAFFRINQGKAADFQAHSAKFTTSLSIVYLGREVIKKQVYISDSELILAGEILLQMVINTQLEQGIYD